MSQTPYTALLSALHECGAGYALLRDHPETAGIRDLDLLIDSSHRRRFLECGAQQHFRLIKSSRKNPGKMVLLRWDQTGTYILDVHERLIYRGFEYLDAKTVLSRRRRLGDYYFLSPEDELLTLFLHNLLGKGEIQEKHRLRLEQLLATPLDENYLNRHLKRFGLADIFAEARRDFALLARKPDAVGRLRKQILRTLRFRPMSNAGRRLRIRLLGLLERWLGPRRGALVAFVGPDGCGKSSITSALRAQFRQATLTTDIVYLGPWGQSRLPLQRLLKRFNIKPDSAQEKARFQQNSPGPAPPPGRAQQFLISTKGLIFYLALAIELWFRYLALVQPRLRRGRIVLADRYIHDILIGYKNRPVRTLRRLREWMCRLYPRPDLTVLLDAPPEIIHNRKPQFSVEQLAGIRRRYQEVGRRFDFHVLDASISPETTLASFHETLLPLVLQTLKP